MVRIAAPCTFRHKGRIADLRVCARILPQIVECGDSGDGRTTANGPTDSKVIKARQIVTFASSLCSPEPAFVGKRSYFMLVL